jgi:hypothetical protein
LFVWKVRTRNCPRSVACSLHGEAATIGAMRPTPAELEVARALIARVKAADPSIKRVDELLVCAAVACRADELRWRRPTLRSGDGRPKQVTDWGARLEKLEQTLAAESSSSLLVQPAWIDKNVLARLLRHQFTGPDNPGLCLCQVHRLLAADRGWGVARALISRLEAAQFLALRGGC